MKAHLFFFQIFELYSPLPKKEFFSESHGIILYDSLNKIVIPVLS